MSTSFLKGKLSVKTKDFPELKELLELFSSKNLKEFDKNFKTLIENKISIKEKESFVKEDINYHRNLMKKEVDLKLKSFFQFLFLPLDWFRFLCIKNNHPSEADAGYFKMEELEEIKNNRFPPFVVQPIKKIFESFNKEKNEGLTKKVFSLQENFFKSLKSKYINLYFEIEKSKDENFFKILKSKSFKIIPFEGYYPEEIFKFYLPYFFRKEFIFFNNDFEFLFFYFKQRLVLWKTLSPEKV